MKNKLTFAMREVLFFIVGHMLVLLVINRLIPKEGVSKYEAFYKEKGEFDILFFGSSRVLDAFEPMELWNEYKIKSYNMAQHSEGLARNYAQIKTALVYHKPQLVVVDISMFYGRYGVDINSKDDRAALHKQIDHMPLSLSKWKIVKELCSPIYAEYLFPFILYHDRWADILPDLKKQTNSINLGSENRGNIMKLVKEDRNNSSFSDVFYPEGIKLDDIIRLGKENDVDILFICMPCCENVEVYSTLNCIERYLEENGANYWNIDKEETCLEYAYDFADTSHVNVAGNR